LSATRAAIAVLAVALLHASAAPAAVRYVSPGGSAGGDGTRQSPWTLGRANGELQPGDVCVMLPGFYEDEIHPVRSGQRGARITYLGRLDDPDDATVKSIELDQAWISVKGVRSKGGATLEWPSAHDSVAYCELKSYMGFHGAKHCVSARNEIDGTVAFMLDRGQSNAGKANSEYDTLRANRIDMGTVARYHSFKIRGYTQHCLIDSNRVSAVFDQATDDGVARIMYNSSYITLRDNSWRFEAASVCPNHGEPWYGFVMRDSARHYLFERDTMLLGMNSHYRIRGLLNHSGSFPQSVADNRWVHCVYRTNSYMYCQDRFLDSEIESSVFAGADDRAVYFAEPVVGSRFENFTVLADGRPQRPGMFDAAVVSSTGGANRAGNDRETEKPAVKSTPQSATKSAATPGAPASKSANVTAHATTPAPRDETKRVPTKGAIAKAGAITNLEPAMVSKRELVLTWTAPAAGAGVGAPRAYEMRWSRSAITSANFTRAKAVPRQPMAMKPGQVQSYVMLGLSPGTRYWFALRARDDAGRWSPISNVASATTAGEGEVARGPQHR